MPKKQKWCKCDFVKWVFILKGSFSTLVAGMNLDPAEILDKKKSPCFPLVFFTNGKQRITQLINKPELNLS